MRVDRTREIPPVLLQHHHRQTGVRLGRRREFFACRQCLFTAQRTVHIVVVVIAGGGGRGTFEHGDHFRLSAFASRRFVLPDSIQWNRPSATRHSSLATSSLACVIDE